MDRPRASESEENVDDDDNDDDDDGDGDGSLFPVEPTAVSRSESLSEPLMVVTP
jgi:hypothetical protein